MPGEPGYSASVTVSNFTIFLSLQTVVALLARGHSLIVAFFDHGVAISVRISLACASRYRVAPVA